MKMILKSGRWLIITFVLLSLTGHMPLDRPGRQEDAQVATLVHLARTNLRARLGIRAEIIALESAHPLTFFCPAPDTCQERQPGYIIRLAVDNVVYEYNARMVGKQYILWHEVEIGQPLNGEEKWEGHYASSGAANGK
jgi:hypothetical protein